MCLLRYGRQLSAAIAHTQLHTVLALTFVLCSITGSATIIWKQKPFDQRVVIGNTAKFGCMLENLNGSTVLWLKGTTTLFLNGQPNTGVDPRYHIEAANNLVIDNVNMSDDSLYTCSVFGFEEVQVRLTVLLPPGPPQISSNSSSSPLVENSVISFTCSSTGGKPYPDIVWLWNGQPFTSAIVTRPDVMLGTSSSQIIVDIQRTDHLANYTCKVTNDAVSGNSPLVASRILYVQYSPSLHFEPGYSPYRVKMNTAVTIKCVIDANPQVSTSNIQWTKNDQRISTGTSDTLRLLAVQKSDSGTYSCKATNYIQNLPKLSTTSVVIDVIYAPIVGTQSVIIANISSVVTLSCQVDANPLATSVAWQKTGDTISYNRANFEFTATKRRSGNYTCTAINRLEPSGSPSDTISSTGFTTLRVQYAPGQASINPTSPVLVSQSIMLTCSIDDPGYPPPSYEWRRIGIPQLLQSSQSLVFRINAAQLGNNGNYTCLPRNVMGQGLPAMILVEVNSPPMFTQSSPATPVHTIPISQSNYLLEHKIEGRPLPTVQWYKDGVPLSTMPELYRLETSHTIVEIYKYLVTARVSFIGSGRNQNGLRIADMGNYSCEVMSSTRPEPTIMYTYLSIKFMPQITPVSRVAADAAERTNLTCEAQANPTPIFYWYKGSQLLTNNSRITLTHEVLDGVATYAGHLLIHQMEGSDYGNYLCEANNTEGHSRATVKLSPRAKPEAPSNLIAISLTWESVKLQWDTGFNGGYDQTFFVHMTSLFGEKTVEAYRDGTNFNVTRLMPHTSYTFRVFGKNILGRGTDSIGFTTTTNLLVFPPLTEIPQFKVDDKVLSIPNDLSHQYCLRVEVSRDNSRTWSVVEPCVPPTDGSVTVTLQSATNVNVSVCLVYRPEVCGEAVVSEIREESTADLSETEVIIIGVVCAVILIVLLIILIVIICRRHRNKANYTQDPHSPRTVQQGNGSLPTAKPRGYENQGMAGVDLIQSSRSPISQPGYPTGTLTRTNHQTGFNSGTLTRNNNEPGYNSGTLTRNNNEPGYNSGTLTTDNDQPGYTLPLSNIQFGLPQLDNRNGYPAQYLHPGDHAGLNTSYDSHTLDKQYEYEMNRRNANISGDPYYADKPADMSFNMSNSPRTPTKDPQQFISVPEDPKREGGSVGSHESGYSTPEGVKPKKHWRINLPPLKLRHLRGHRDKGMRTNPDLMPYTHYPPGHTCGLPCCSEDAQVQLRARSRPRSCIGFQDTDAVAQNFTFSRRQLLKGRLGLDSGFFSVAQPREVHRASIPKFGTVREGVSIIADDQCRHNFLKGREITLPELVDNDATEKLYLQDFDAGESEDLFEMAPDDEIKYYMSASNSEMAQRGVPYSGEDFTGRQMYPWELMMDIKSNTSQDDQSKTDDTCSSCHYEVLRDPDETRSDIGSAIERLNITDDTTCITPPTPTPDLHMSKPLPMLPPKPPLQNLFNHPPLPKSPTANSKSNKFDTKFKMSLSQPKGDSERNFKAKLEELFTQSQSVFLPSKGETAHNTLANAPHETRQLSNSYSTFPTSDGLAPILSDSGKTKYNTYTSVYSVSNFDDCFPKSLLNQSYMSVDRHYSGKVFSRKSINDLYFQQEGKKNVPQSNNDYAKFPTHSSLKRRTTNDTQENKSYEDCEKTVRFEDDVISEKETDLQTPSEDKSNRDMKTSLNSVRYDSVWDIDKPPVNDTDDNVGTDEISDEFIKNGFLNIDIDGKVPKKDKHVNEIVVGDDIELDLLKVGVCESGDDNSECPVTLIL